MTDPDEFFYYYDPISKIVAHTFDVDVHDPYLRINDIDPDFMDIVVLIMALEDHYEISIPDEDVNDLINGSVRDIVYYIVTKLHE